MRSQIVMQIVCVALFAASLQASCAQPADVGLEGTPVGQGGHGGVVAPGGTGGDAFPIAMCSKCSADLHFVLDCNNNVKETRPDDKGWAEGVCIPACDAAIAAKSNVGCEYYSETLPQGCQAVNRNRIEGIEEEPPWRIVGTVDETKLTFETESISYSDTLNLGQVKAFRTAGPFIVRSQDDDHPIYVAGYMTGGWAEGWFDCRGPGIRPCAPQLREAGQL